MAQRCLGGTLHGDVFAYDNGPMVPVAVLDLLAGLDSRGVHVQENGDRLRVFRDDGEPIDYQDGERDLIVKYKLHILAIVAFVDGQKEPEKQPSRYEQPKAKQASKKRA